MADLTAAENFDKLLGVVQAYIEADAMTRGEAYRDLEATARWVAGNYDDLRGWPKCYERERQRAEAAEKRAAELERENADLRARLLTAAGDDLCRLSQEEIKALGVGAIPIPPKGEFLASCERFHAQIAGEAGVNHNCLTLAQLIAEAERLRAELAAKEDLLRKATVEIDHLNIQMADKLAAKDARIRELAASAERPRLPTEDL